MVKLLQSPVPHSQGVDLHSSITVDVRYLMYSRILSSQQHSKENRESALNHRAILGLCSISSRVPVDQSQSAHAWWLLS